ncbi:diguanylate cyclase [Clostridium punense]|uniref:Diguanylate cyclase n=2 Tax=Clostridium TaxID=1485 RepID=A0ABS4K7D8_9CLOT|nr:GGDEF domain-containing protein [Clostridium punense]MBP2023041.1 diguanylate cyclase [Clostridium punense]
MNDIFINLLLLVAATFVSGHLLKDISEDIINSLIGKIVLGIGGGLLGILMMIYTIKIQDTTTLLDLRVFAIMMVSYIGGLIPTIVCGIIMWIFRTTHFGVSISSGVFLIQVILYIICFFIIDKKNKDFLKRWILKTLTSLFILITFFAYLLKDVENVITILFLFSLVIIFVAILEYYLLEYVRSSNELYRKYKKDSTKDFLTGLYNTRQFDSMLNTSFERTLENKERLSCLMIDIDHFKKVNDTYGHPIGDIVLSEVAKVIRNTARSIDVVGRIGGEEFCALLTNCPKDYAMEVALRIKTAIENYHIPIGEGKFIKVTVSVGVSSYPETLTNLNDLKEQADVALYNAKRSGRNRVCVNDFCKDS